MNGSRQRYDFGNIASYFGKTYNLELFGADYAKDLVITQNTTYTLPKKAIYKNLKILSDCTIKAKTIIVLEDVYVAPGVTVAFEAYTYLVRLSINDYDNTAAAPGYWRSAFIDWANFDQDAYLQSRTFKDFDENPISIQDRQVYSRFNFNSDFSPAGGGFLAYNPYTSIPAPALNRIIRYGPTPGYMPTFSHPVEDGFNVLSNPSHYNNWEYQPNARGMMGDATRYHQYTRYHSSVGTIDFGMDLVSSLQVVMEESNLGSKGLLGLEGASLSRSTSAPFKVRIRRQGEFYARYNTFYSYYIGSPSGKIYKSPNSPSAEPARDMLPLQDEFPYRTYTEFATKPGWVGSNPTDIGLGEKPPRGEKLGMYAMPISQLNSELIGVITDLDKNVFYNGGRTVSDTHRSVQDDGTGYSGLRSHAGGTGGGSGGGGGGVGYSNFKILTSFTDDNSKKHDWYIKEMGGRGGSLLFLLVGGNFTNEGTLSTNGGNAFEMSTPPGMGTMLDSNDWRLDGSGGGGGGLFYLDCLGEIHNTGTIESKGGNGSNGYISGSYTSPSPSKAYGGGGGAGGYISIKGKIVTQGTLDVAGGIAGDNSDLTKADNIGLTPRSTWYYDDYSTPGDVAVTNPGIVRVNDALYTGSVILNGMNNQGTYTKMDTLRGPTAIMDSYIYKTAFGGIV